MSRQGPRLIDARKGDEDISLSKRKKELQQDLSRAIKAALPASATVNRILEGPDSPYRPVAEILVALRHEFRGRDGQGPDLKGRSAGYRVLVKKAYVRAGADPTSPVSKRLTAGTSYWVRKILLEKYGSSKLNELGVISNGSIGAAAPGRAVTMRRGGPRLTGHNKLRDLQETVGTLNGLASDPEVIPTEELVLAALRAVNLLRRKLANGQANGRAPQSAVG